MITFPIAILLTLVRTVKKEKTKGTNISIAVGTAVVAFVGLITITMILYSLSLGFGTWVNFSIDYRNRNNPDVTINSQMFDAGTLGYRAKRVVEVKPFTPLFNIVTAIDTTKLDKSEWKYVNEEGDLKFP